MSSALGPDSAIPDMRRTTRDRPLHVEERMLEFETALVDGLKPTLPPESYPLNGFSLVDQVYWSIGALGVTRRRRVWQNLRRFIRRVLTLGL